MKPINQKKTNTILFVNHCLTGGGSEKTMTLIANYFASHDYEVEMVLLNEHPRTYGIDERIKISECYCPIKGNKIIWHLNRIKTLRDTIKKSKAPIIVTFMWDINMNVILASAGLGKKIIASERCDPHNETRKLMRFAMHFILPFADMTVFQTEMVKGYYPKRVQRKSVVIPNSISEDLPLPDRDTVKSEIVAVGRLTDQKNFEMLIRAFKKVTDVKDKITLVIYGEGAERKKLERIIKELSLTDKVELPGYINDVNLKMRNSMIYVNSSNYEGISNAMLEAMAMGIPCVCTDCPVGGASMVIRNEENGLLVPINDDVSMADSIIRLIDDKALYERIQENAMEVRGQYSIEKIGERWVQVINDTYNETNG